MNEPRNGVVVLVDNARDIKRIKTLLEKYGVFDKSRTIESGVNCDKNSTHYALPVTTHMLNSVSDSDSITIPFTTDQLFDVQLETPVIVTNLFLPMSKLGRLVTPCQAIQIAIKNFLIAKEISHWDKLIEDLPRSWQQHGDMVILHDCFKDPYWDTMDQELWCTVARALKCSRLAILRKVAPDKFRSPVVRLLVGESGWVEHCDNGITYVFDVTHSMFSAGNITEKMRMAALNCREETIVDLFAGVGYFSIPLLVHAKAKLLHACEWNPVAMEGLRRGLHINNVTHRCELHFGDNIHVAPKGVADRVILGLIPTSYRSWATACECLNPHEGGWLHVHGNVDTSSPSMESCDHDTSKDLKDVCSENMTSNKADNVIWHSWAKKVAVCISTLLQKRSDIENWTVFIRHIEHVKSYAPHVEHLVVDLECRPY